jgi:hypothetical protein
MRLEGAKAQIVAAKIQRPDTGELKFLVSSDSMKANPGLLGVWDMKAIGACAG